MVASVVVDATLLTLTLALAAFGLAIIFGLTGVINLGHGAMITIGAYLTWAGVNAGIPFVPAVLLAALGVGLVGLVFEVAVIRHFYDRPFETVLLTWGFFLVTTEVIKIVFGTNIRSVENPLTAVLTLGPVNIPAYRAVLGLITLVLLAATALVFFRTRLGIQIRATIQHREMASLLGVNERRMRQIVFVTGSLLAGLAGGLLTPITSIDPYLGMMWLVRSFFVVTVGGIGQLLAGTLVGSFVIGGSETFFALLADQVFAQTIVFAIAVVLLRFRPTGVLGRGRA